MSLSFIIRVCDTAEVSTSWAYWFNKKAERGRKGCREEGREWGKGKVKGIIICDPFVCALKLFIYNV